jgi:hypothetical protein
MLMNSTVRPNGHSGTDSNCQTTPLYRSLSTSSRMSTSLKFRWSRRVSLCCGPRSLLPKRYVCFTVTKSDADGIGRGPNVDEDERVGRAR